MAWLNPGRWLAVLLFLIALGVAHNYDKRQAVKKAVAAAHTEHAALALAASEANRAKEKELILSNERVRNDYAKEKARLVAANRVTADRLREYQAASNAFSSPGGDTYAATGTDSPFATVASECTRAIAALDEHAQGLRATARALQEFANNLHLK